MASRGFLAVGAPNVAAVSQSVRSGAVVDCVLSSSVAMERPIQPKTKKTNAPIMRLTASNRRPIVSVRSAISVAIGRRRRARRIASFGRVADDPRPEVFAGGRPTPSEHISNGMSCSSKSNRRTSPGRLVQDNAILAEAYTSQKYGRPLRDLLTPAHKPEPRSFTQLHRKLTMHSVAFEMPQPRCDRSHT